MVIPLHDDNPTTTRPYVTVGIMIACVLMYVWQHLLLSTVGAQQAAYAFGLVPAVLTGREMLPPEIAVIPAWATILTSMFMHGGFWHLAGNMLYLWIFGNNVEDAMGHARFFIFYVAVRSRGGVRAGTAQSRIDRPDGRRQRRDLGRARRLHAAVSARARVVRVAARFPHRASSDDSRPSGCWRRGSALQLLMGSIAAAQSAGESQGGIAFGAHIGGFIAGLALVTIFKRRDVPLWRRH